MTHFIWKRSDLKTNPYILLGPSIRFPLAAEKEIRFTNSFDAGIDIGIGFHKAFSNFNIMPELRLSIGFINIMQNDNSPNLRYTSISLILNFLG